MSRVTWPIIRGGKTKMSTFWKPWPGQICSFTLSLSVRYDEVQAIVWEQITTTFKPRSHNLLATALNIAYIPIQRLQSSLCMRSITWPVDRDPPKSHVTIFLTPNYLLWGYNDDYGRLHVKAVFGRNDCAVKTGPQNGGCFRNVWV